MIFLIGQHQSSEMMCVFSSVSQVCILIHPHSPVSQYFLMEISTIFSFAVKTKTVMHIIICITVLLLSSSLSINIVVFPFL